MTVTRETLTDDPDQVSHLIKWWVSRTKWRYHRVRKDGTIGDFINDVWLRLMIVFRDGRSIECSLSTLVINTCNWELLNTKRIGEPSSRIHRKAIRQAEPVRDHHSVYDDQYLVDDAFRKELQHAFAWALRALTWRQAVTIRARYGLFGDNAMTLEQVGRALKLTRESVRQIESKGLKGMQHISRARRLLPFADSIDP